MHEEKKTEQEEPESKRDAERWRLTASWKLRDWGGMGGEEGMSASKDQRLSQCGRAGVRQLSCPRQLTRWLRMGGVSWKSSQMSGKFQEPARKKKKTGVRSLSFVINKSIRILRPCIFLPRFTKNVMHTHFSAVKRSQEKLRGNDVMWWLRHGGSLFSCKCSL